MKKKVSVNDSYDIYIGHDLLEEMDFITQIKGHKILIISDDIVWNIYNERIINWSIKFNLDILKFIISNGEQKKSLQTINEVFNILYENCFIKTDYIIALGGGVIGDIAGLVSATYMRGINLINIPTTLIAQIDSSIGGKNGVNFRQNKNLIGTFYDPRLVICDIDFLKTLDNRQFSSGMAEVIKYCMIKNGSLIGLLNDVNSNLDDIIMKCIEIKKDIVEEDKFDRNRRKILNFGHTIGHILELSEGNRGLLHGEAVGLGMLIITNAAIKNHLSTQNVYDEIYKLLIQFQLPIECNVNINEICEKIFMDKKCRNNTIDITIVKNCGDTILFNLGKNSIKNFFM